MLVRIVFVVVLGIPFLIAAGLVWLIYIIFGAVIAVADWAFKVKQ